MMRILTALAPLAMLGTVAAHAQDAAAGKQVFAQCAACHSINGSNGVGPSLKGVVGRQAGTFAGFRYSRAMRDANITWTVQNLDAYIANPQKVVPGNLMPFSGLPEAKERAELVAYLETLK